MQAAAQEGDTAPPALEDVVDLHFVALVNQNDRLVELDGRKSFPIDHGKTSNSTLLQVGRDSEALAMIIDSCLCSALWWSPSDPGGLPSAVVILLEFAMTQVLGTL